MPKELIVRKTNIDGLLEIDLVLNVDKRGWFKENYQAAKMQAMGLPSFEVVQNNFSFNSEAGVTRGLHAEPWEKYISLANGKAFGAWVDLREGPSFGQLYTTDLTPDKAVFVPRGIANAYQTLAPNVTYTYLVNAHWSPEVKYVAINLFDPELDIQWPIAKAKALVSEKDLNNPMLSEFNLLED